MKRFINNVRTFKVVESSNHKHKYVLASSNSSIPDNREILLGDYGKDEKSLFIYINGELKSFSFDDETYDFIIKERDRIKLGLKNLKSAKTDRIIGRREK